jgi:hypothetical protein
MNADEDVRFAMIIFSGAEMLVPLLILKADGEVLQSLTESEQ